MTPLRIAVCGATGKTGKEIVALIESSPDLQLAGAVSRENFSGVSEITTDIWIDFSRPETTLQLLSRVTAPVLVGTTGFDGRQREQMESDYAKRLPICLAPNLSLGILLLRQMLKGAGSAPEMGFSFFVEEEHHDQKVDAPSGTALQLIADAERLGMAPQTVHSLRAGGIVGNHFLRWISADEEVVLSHRAFSRRAFARGALLAARKFYESGPKAGLWSLEKIFETENVR